MKLTQNDLKYIIHEATNRILSEISWGTANDAAKISDKWGEELDDALYYFRKAASNMDDALRKSNIYKGKQKPLDGEGEKLAYELCDVWSRIEKFVRRKMKQPSSLEAHANDKFQKAFGGRTSDQVSNDIEGQWDKYFDDPNTGNIPWKQYRKGVLSKDEQDFNDRNP